MKYKIALVAFFSLVLSGCTDSTAMQNYAPPAQRQVTPIETTVESKTVGKVKVETPKVEAIKTVPAVVAPVVTKPVVAETIKVETPSVTAPKTEAVVPLSNDNTYINSQGDEIHSPAYAPTIPPGASARCNDGTYSFSASRRGTCSHHGGVVEWY